MDAIGFGIGYAVGPPAGTARAGAAPFNPGDLFASGEQGAWYEPSDLSSMFQDSAGTIPAAVNSPVGRINDKSGNARHLTQGTSAARPLLRADSGGRNYLEFDGVDDRLDNAAITVSQPSTHCAGYRASATGSIVLFDGLSSRQHIYTSGTWRLFAGSDVSGGIAQATAAVVDTITFEGASSNHRRNGVAGATVNAGVNSLSGLRLGANNSLGTFYPGRVYAFFVRGGAMTAEQRTSLETYMAGKAGVTI